MAQERVTIPTEDIDVVTDRLNAPRLEALLFADYAVRGKDLKATVAGVFDRVLIDPEKKVSGRFFVFLRAIETIEDSIEIRVIDPKGRVVANGTTGIEEPDALIGQLAPRSITAIFPLALTLGPEGVEGMYWFEISYKGLALGGSGLRVEFHKKED